MIQHVVMWKFHENTTESEKEMYFLTFQKYLMDLAQKMDGVLRLELHQALVPSSTMDVILMSEFESLECLDAYQKHEDHQAAVSYWRDKVISRTCVDFEN